MAKRWIDLSQPFYNGMRHAPGRTPPQVDTHRFEFDRPTGLVTMHTTRVEFWTHMGTHVDAPRHFFPDRPSIEQVPLDRLAGEGVVWDVRRPNLGVITADDLARATPAVQKGDFVLLYTGWGEKYDKGEEYEEHPYLDEGAAQWLVEKRVNMLGLDTITPEAPQPLRSPDFYWPIHKILLGNDVLVMEHLCNLGELAGRRAMIFAFPLKVQGADGGHARVVALVDD